MKRAAVSGTVNRLEGEANEEAAAEEDWDGELSGGKCDGKW